MGLGRKKRAARDGEIRPAVPCWRCWSRPLMHRPDACSPSGSLAGSFRPKPCWPVGHDASRSLTVDTSRWYSGGCRNSRISRSTRLVQVRPSPSLRRGDTHTRHPLFRARRVSIPGAAASSSSAEVGQSWALCHHPIPSVSFLLLMLRSGCRARSLGRTCRYFSRNGGKRGRPSRRSRREIRQVTRGGVPRIR